MPPQSGPGGLAVMASMEVPAGRPVAARPAARAIAKPAELASGWTGGVFGWVSEGMSPRWACSPSGASSR
jgi:hypothetical protein